MHGPPECGPTSQQSVLAAALMAFLIPMPLPLPLPKAGPLPDGRAWQELLAGFQARGVAVLMIHPRCREPDLEGLYVHGRTEVVVCPRGEPSTTLRHEGWHLVQNLCLAGGTWLAPQSVEANLSKSDRRELALLVRSQRRPWEAEARVMARVRPAEFLKAVDQACAGRLPFGSGGKTAGEQNIRARPEAKPILKPPIQR
jgi:hypothetical protein